MNNNDMVLGRHAGVCRDWDDKHYHCNHTDGCNHNHDGICNNCQNDCHKEPCQNTPVKPDYRPDHRPEHRPNHKPNYRPEHMPDHRPEHMPDHHHPEPCCRPIPPRPVQMCPYFMHPCPGIPEVGQDCPCYNMSCPANTAAEDAGWDNAYEIRPVEHCVRPHHPAGPHVAGIDQLEDSGHEWKLAGAPSYETPILGVREVKFILAEFEQKIDKKLDDMIAKVMDASAGNYSDVAKVIEDMKESVKVSVKESVESGSDNTDFLVKAINEASEKTASKVIKRVDDTDKWIYRLYRSLYLKLHNVHRFLDKTSVNKCVVPDNWSYDEK